MCVSMSRYTIYCAINIKLNQHVVLIILQAIRVKAAKFAGLGKDFFLEKVKKMVENTRCGMCK